MEVYRRYFRVTSGPLLDAVNEANETNKMAQESYSAILKEIGAKPGYYHRNQRLVSIVFDHEPDKNLYKKKDSGWYPKKNIKEGKLLAARIEEVKTKNIQECLEVIGLSNAPSLFGNGRCHCTTLTIIPEKSPVIYISVPWYDEDPAKIKQYEKDNKTGFHGDINLDSVRWKPTSEMKPVKSWEVDRHIEEWNEEIKKAE